MKQVNTHQLENITNQLSEYLDTFVIVGFDAYGNRWKMVRESKPIHCYALEAGMRSMLNEFSPASEVWVRNMPKDGDE